MEKLELTVYNIMKHFLLTLVTFFFGMMAAQAQCAVTPEGEPQLYELSAEAYYSDGMQIGYAALGVYVSYSEDGKSVYISNLFPMYEFKSKEMWVKGNVEGNTITIPAQLVYSSEAMTGSTYYWIGTDDGKNELTGFTLTIRNDGALVQSTNNQYIALASCDENGFFLKAYHLESNLKIQPVKGDLTPVTVPESATVEDAIYEYFDSGSKACYDIEKIAFDGNDVYFHGLTPDIDAWVKGTYDDGVLTVPGRQYLGISDKGYVLFFNPAVYKGFNALGEVDYEFQDAVFTYDEEAKTLFLETGDEGIFFLMETGGNYGVYKNPYNFTIKTSHDFNGTGGETGVPTPSDPYKLTVTTGKGYPYFKFYLKPVGTNNEVLDVNKLFWRLFKDGEPMTILASDYSSLTEDHEMFNYEFSDNSTNFMHSTATSGSFAYMNQCLLQHINAADFQTIGVQALYIDGENTTYSNIVTVDKNGTNNTIPVGIEEVLTPSAHSAIYDLQGRRVNTLSHGLYIINGKKVLR